MPCKTLQVLIVDDKESKNEEEEETEHAHIDTVEVSMGSHPRKQQRLKVIYRLGASDHVDRY